MLWHLCMNTLSCNTLLIATLYRYSNVMKVKVVHEHIVHVYINSRQKDEHKQLVKLAICTHSIMSAL